MSLPSCDFRWVTGSWEGCSQTCGADGVQMRMIYCVRTAMVTSLSTNTTAIATNKPEKSVRFDRNWDEFGISANEARRLPEVTDDENSSGIDNLHTPSVDAWKATIKDHRVILFNLTISGSHQIIRPSSFIQKKLAVENEVLHWNPNAITDPALCKDQSPMETQPCNRIPCPGVWIEKTWKKVNKKMSENHFVFLIIWTECSAPLHAALATKRCNSFA